MSAVNSGDERRTAVATAQQQITSGKSLAQLGLSKLPEGGYAMFNKKTQKIHFFRVSYGNPRGKWAGYTFLVELHGDNEERIRDAGKRNVILNAICRDPMGCMATYGRELGKCGQCGRTLTSEWRLKGIGPECFKNYGQG